MSKAFVALMPFDLHVAAGASHSPIVHTVDGRRVTFYWPFWHESSRGRPLHPVNAELVPARDGAVLFPVQPRSIRLEIIPSEGKTFANAFRIDVDGENTDTDFATYLTNELIRNLRAGTGQWWMGHPHQEGEGLVRAEYAIDSNGVAQDKSVQSSIEVRSRFGIETPLVPHMFVAACGAIANASELPVYAELLYDAVFYAIERDDLRRALLDACVACDMAIFHESIRAAVVLGKSELYVRHNLCESDQLKNLKKGLPVIFGAQADFPSHHPTTFEQVRALWAARGSIAHGLAPSTGQHGRAALPSRAASFEMLKAAIALVDWLQKLPPSTRRPAATATGVS